MTSKELREYYRSTEFKLAYEYDGELGVIFGERETEIRLWSPLSRRVTINFYKTGDGDDLLSFHPMEKINKGVWLYKTEKDVEGMYYDFTLKSRLGEEKSADPYAVSAGLNGNRSMVIRLENTNPPGWKEDRAPKREIDDFIYEVHIKEFSYDKDGGFLEENRGKYKAFTENDTTLFGEGEFKTGLSYIKDLGVTHIQLLPAFDYASVREENNEEFNWGYDPLNYNVPEGSYASDPYDGKVRIREFKEMVQAIHNAGLRVVMDVVYNHTFSLESWFQKTVPWYFYRVDDLGDAADGSACGNDFATEMKMAEKYILESVLFWAREYHIDGFRFDLMGLINVNLMNKIRRRLDEEFGEGEILVYGEPWAADSTFVEDDEPLAVKNNIAKLHNGIGMFSDDIRDGIKGSVFYEGMRGFANGESDFTPNIKMAIRAFRGDEKFKRIKNATNQKGESEVPKVKSPNQLINYVSCHDNQTLWDKLTATTADILLRKKQYRLAASIYLMAQGRSFIYSGEEFLRTKNGEHNTYRSSVELNKMDWKLTKENKDMVDFYKGLIALRKEFTGISDKGEEAFGNITFIKESAGFLVFKVENKEREGVTPRWKEVIISFNGTDEIKHCYLPDGDYELLSDGEDSLSWKKEGGRPISKEFETPPYTAYILGFKRAWEA